jgi:hypothetical protein
MRMARTNKFMKNSCHPGLSRRDFLKTAAATGIASLLAGCRPASLPTSTPTNVTTSTTASTPTANLRRPEILKFYPDAPSRVVHTRHAGSWNGDTLKPEALREMLDASITKLTGQDGARSAWAVLFSPDERIAIKVNTYGGSTNGSKVFTHAPLVFAVTQALQEAGIPAGQITIYDINSADLEGAGYAIHRDAPGVRCLGTAASWDALARGEGEYESAGNLLGKPISLSRILLNSDAVINMPVLKTHSWSGLTFALKNQYGSIDNPERFHEWIAQAIPQLNALTPIRDRARLFIGDMLEAACLQGAWGYGDSDWSIAQRGDSILMSFDPVALDTLGLQQACQLAKEHEESTDWIEQRANLWLATSASLGLGTDDLKNMELVDIQLG